MQISSSVTVLGQGSVRTPVDRVELGISVEVDRAEPGPAFEAAAASVTAVLAVLADAGVDSRHVRTADLRLGPRTIYQDAREVVVSYASGQRLVATLEGLSGVPRLLADLATTGVEGVRFDGIAFSAADSADYLAQARVRAMSDAREKAADYARLAGRELGEVISVREVTRGGGPAPVAMELAAAAGRSMPVAGGEATSDVAVEVVFGLR